MIDFYISSCKHCAYNRNSVVLSFAWLHLKLENFVSKLIYSRTQPCLRRIRFLISSTANISQSQTEVNHEERELAQTKNHFALTIVSTKTLKHCL